jgi:hypothetical protein
LTDANEDDGWIDKEEEEEEFESVHSDEMRDCISESDSRSSCENESSRIQIIR